MSDFIQFSCHHFQNNIVVVGVFTQQSSSRNTNLEKSSLEQPCWLAGRAGAAKSRRSNCNGPGGGRAHARPAVRGAARTGPCYPNPGSVTGKPETTICVSTCNFNQISQAVIIDTFEVISVTLYQQCEGSGWSSSRHSQAVVRQHLGPET